MSNNFIVSDFDRAESFMLDIMEEIPDKDRNEWEWVINFIREQKEQYYKQLMELRQAELNKLTR